MTCRWVQEQLSAYLDDHLNGRDLATVWKHLQACSACRQQEVQLRHLGQLLKGLAPPQAPPHFWAETHRRLRQQATGSRPHGRWFRVPWRSLVLPAIAAFLAALVLWNVWPLSPGAPTRSAEAQLRVTSHAVSSMTQPAAGRGRLVGLETPGR